MNLERVLRHSQGYSLYRWVRRRNPPEHGAIFLSQRRVYILPTRHGLVFGVALVLMLIGSINYQMSLGYVLTFLLASMGVVSILHTFRNLAHLTVSAGKVENVFAGDQALFHLKLDNLRRVARCAINLYGDAGTITCDLAAERSLDVAVPMASARRGWLQLSRVTLDTRFPLGLFRAWAYVQPDMRALVYPMPDHSELPWPQVQPDVGDAVSLGTGTDDFLGLRNYQPSDAPRHIAWKALARTDQLLTKMFAGRASPELWFDWKDLPPSLATEARISRLTRWVLLAHEGGLHYGLRLPDTEIPMGEGESQYLECLKALALYEEKRQ